MMEKVAVVTGGSAGIGRKTAKLLAQAGYRVYELSRSGSDFPGVTHLTADLCAEESIRSAFSELQRREGRLDLLVNNAGWGISGAAEFTELDRVRRLFDVNYFGMLACIQQAVPLMRANGGGRILNISSVAAVFSIPFQSFYSASKAAVNMLTLALRNELAPFGISVCALMPGDVHTSFTDAREKETAGAALYGDAITRAVAAMEKDERNGMPPEAIARKVCRIAQKRSVKPLYTAGAQYSLFVLLGKLLPARVANFLVGKLYS